MATLKGVVRLSPVLRNEDPPTHRSVFGVGGTGASKPWRVFGNPWRDDYPWWIWGALKHSRADKDISGPPLRLFNSTKIYEIFLKDNRRYCMFVMGAGLLTSWMWSEMWNSCWRSINKKKLYNDAPYVYPEDE